MKEHQVIFENLKKFLKEKINSELIEEDNGNHISIDKSEFWSSCYESEFIIGLGMIHSHYGEEYENINKAIESITNLLTKEIKYTIYKKGKLIFKEKTEIILSESNLIEFGSASAMFYPFWKKTEIEVINNKSILDKNFELELKEKLSNRI